MYILRSLSLAVVAWIALSGAANAAAKIAGIAFVDSSVTSQGSKAKLPQGAIVYPSGTTITGTTGCPTDRYRTTGLIVAVIDYDGPPTAASLQVTRSPATGGTFQNAPYYLDLNAGRTLQFLGPVFDNGSYGLHFEAGFQGASRTKLDANFKLARVCAPPH